MITTHATSKNWKTLHLTQYQNLCPTKISNLCLTRIFLYHPIKSWKMIKTIINLLLEKLNSMKRLIVA
jgi:hypothetical protein